MCYECWNDMLGNVFYSILNDLINELIILNLVYSYLLGFFYVIIIIGKFIFVNLEG